jgi:hypothetical protein
MMQDFEQNKMTTTREDANSRQVGGDHYKTAGLQHWDLFGPDYLIGYATKYMRWRKKGGVQDLEKAIHVVEKLREVLTEANRPKYDVMNVDAWCRDAGLDWVEQKIVKLIMFSRGKNDLGEAIAGIRHLIDREKNGFASGGLALRQVDAPKVARPDAERPDADESRHGSLYPWHVSYTEWSALDATRAALMQPFYRKMGTVGGWRLEPLAASAVIPIELRACYDLTPTCGWRIRVGDVPADLRDEYPVLQRELNKFEHEQRPRWEQDLYVWRDDKWFLRDDAWAKED